MKLLSALAFVASMASAASAADPNGYENARVMPGVLPEDSIAKLHDHVGTFRLLRKAGGDGKNRQYGEAAVSADDLRRLLLSVGDEREVKDGMTLRSTLVTGDTDPHKDMKVGGDKKFNEDEEVMFVFLNNNEAAYFQIGEEKIPAKAGTVVSFKGNSVVHNTVVPSGEVRLLGPIASRDLQGVTGPVCVSPYSGPCVTEDGGRPCCNVGTFAENPDTGYNGCVRYRDLGPKKVCMCTPAKDWEAQENQVRGQISEIADYPDCPSANYDDWVYATD